MLNVRTVLKGHQRQVMIIEVVRVNPITTIASTNSTSEITNVQLNDGSVSYTCMIACEPNQYAASSAM